MLITVLSFNNGYPEHDKHNKRRHKLPGGEISVILKRMIQYLTKLSRSVLFSIMTAFLISFILGDQSFSSRRQFWQLFPRFSYTWGWRSSTVCAGRRKWAMVSTTGRCNLAGRTCTTSWKRQKHSEEHQSIFKIYLNALKPLTIMCKKQRGAGT